MYNEAKKASNNKYLRQFKPISLRVKPDEAERITEAAQAAGVSAHAYIMEAIRARMDGGHVATGDGAHVATESCIHATKSCNHAAAPLINDGALALAKESADAAGVTVEEWITGAITSQRERDRLAASLRRGK